MSVASVTKDCKTCTGNYNWIATRFIFIYYACICNIERKKINLCSKQELCLFCK